MIHLFFNSTENKLLVVASSLMALIALVLCWPTHSPLKLSLQSIEQPLSLALRPVNFETPQTLAENGLKITEVTPSSHKKSTGTSYQAKTHKPVNINAAGLAELQFLPNVGPKMAQKILAYRKKLGGRFTTIEQLLDVPGIGKKKLAKMRPYCLL